MSRINPHETCEYHLTMKKQYADNLLAQVESLKQQNAELCKVLAVQTEKVHRAENLLKVIDSTSPADCQDPVHFVGIINPAVEALALYRQRRRVGRGMNPRKAVQ